ncbi:MAG: ribonuclease HII [Rhodobacteraceae bacterium]|jgi:ribonuclease HII|nr:ribonuclease HII [Marinovum sp.]RZO41598.1 MAG: ribonuclease HII [Paracoccaceae bacterium]
MDGPDFTFEASLMGQGYPLIAGVDEVGRGPLAGPVTAAAVILDPSNIPQGLNDSKKLSAKRRENLYDLILKSATVAVAHVSVEEIDRINILQASLLAMRNAVAALNPQPAHLLIDGNRVPDPINIPAQPIVKGDGKSLSIAAASIVAKTVRDRLMAELSLQNPGYGWEKNAGYPSKQHILALQRLGVTPHHRRSFRPVHNILYQENK